MTGSRLSFLRTVEKIASFTDCVQPIKFVTSYRAFAISSYRLRTSSGSSSFLSVRDTQACLPQERIMIILIQCNEIVGPRRMAQRRDFQRGDGIVHRISLAVCLLHFCDVFDAPVFYIDFSMGRIEYSAVGYSVSSMEKSKRAFSYHFPRYFPFQSVYHRSPLLEARARRKENRSSEKSLAKRIPFSYALYINTWHL